MDLHPHIIQWLQKMGYNGPMPESLISICNNSTRLLWEQLIDNVLPKDEVLKIRRNIILNRLRSKPLEKQDEFPYKMEEIEVHKRKIKIEQKLKTMEATVLEKRNRVDQLSQKCRMKDITIDFLKKKIGDSSERKYLLDEKKKLLENQNSHVEKTLAELKNVTPVEREDSNSTKEITEILEKCAAKLSSLIAQNQKRFPDQTERSVVSTVKKKPINPHISGNLCHSILEQKMYDEIRNSCMKQTQDQSVRCPSIVGNAKQRLFDVPQIDVESCHDNSGIVPITSPKTPKQRESFGLLPDWRLKEVESEDSFLGTKSRSDTVFSDESCNSIVFKFKAPEMIHEKKSCKEFKSINLCDYATVKEELEKLLHSNNRELIYETLQQCIRQVNEKFIRLVSVYQNMESRSNSINQEDIAKLKVVHIQMEFRIIKQKRVLKDLMSQIASQRLHLLDSVRNKESLPEIQQWLDTHIRNIAMDATLKALEKEISTSNVPDTNDNELQILSSRIEKVKQEIASKLSLIQRTIEEVYSAQKQIIDTKESVLSQIWYVKRFRFDTDWMRPLLEDRWTEEISIFEEFPLAFQKRCVLTDPKTFYRDMCIDNYPDIPQMDSGDLQILDEILESPFSPPETILLSFIRAKMKMGVLKLIENKSHKTSTKLMKEYKLEDLQKQESYINFAIERLKAIIFSSNASRTLSVEEVVKESMSIWADMPLKEFVSDKRLVESRTFKFYQNKLNTILMSE